MATDRNSSPNDQSCPPNNINPADNPYLTVLHQYSAGAISARQAAALMGHGASEHDVYYELVKAGLHLPVPPPAVIDAQVMRAISLFGSSWQYKIKDPLC